MKKIELLAPVGSKEALIGAINAKADAIYLGGKRFSARAYATNFEDEEIEEIIKYAHLRSVLVYIAVNTLIFDDEIDAFIACVDRYVSQGVDALILQDLGMIKLVHERYPKVIIHASTQINAHHINQVRFLKQLGVTRVIMARETSLETIIAIKKQIDIELEVFVHGALCVSYSGNCLFSSMVGHRSGNRGECGQLCRLPYTLLKDGVPVSEEAYLMSTKDLMTLPELETLIKAGIDAFKIEGRMRKVDYVVQTVLSYRKAMEDVYKHQITDWEREIDKLKRVFNREYTEGFLLGAKPFTINNSYRPNHMGVEVGKVIAFNHGKVTIRLTRDIAVGDGIRIIGTKDYGDTISRIIKDGMTVPFGKADEQVIIDSGESIEPGSVVLKTLDHELVHSLDIYLDSDYKLIPLIGKITALINQPLCLEVADDDFHQVSIKSDFLVLEAQKAPATSESITAQIDKLGNTPFFWKRLTIDMDKTGFVPNKVLNELRRAAIEEITALRTNRLIPDKSPEFNREAYQFSSEPFELIAKIRTMNQLNACIEMGIKTVYYEEVLNLDEQAFKDLSLWKIKRRIWPEIDNFIARDNLVANEIGTIYANQGKTMVGDIFLNVTNSETIELLSRYGLKSVTLSLEVNQERIRELVKRYEVKYHTKPNLEVVVYGKTELMLSKYCPIAKTMGSNKTDCHLCEHNQYALKDRMDYEFLLVNDGICNIRVLNPKPLCLIDFVGFFQTAGITKLRMDFTTESFNETQEMIEAFQKAIRKEAYLVNRHMMTYGRFLK
ncbi:MAG: U32 family peptidase [Candidatus Izemoplasmatales bacterium]|jgi:putative protease